MLPADVVEINRRYRDRVAMGSKPVVRRLEIRWIEAHSVKP
jgi:hypothetical protein